MDEKVWLFKLKDVTITTQEPDAIGNDGLVPAITAKNKPDWPVVIQEDKNGKDCYIYSDKKIPGLGVVGENRRIGE